MPINKTDITTSADLADALVVASAQGQFVNTGDLATTGDNANAIDIRAAGASVLNFGDLTTSGQGSVAILIGDAFNPIDGVTFINHGAIHTSGGYLDVNANGEVDLTDAFGDGIDVFGDNARITNFGSIVTTSPDLPGISGIVMAGSGSTVLNHGTIDTRGFGILFEIINGDENHNLAINDGLIHTSGPGFARAMATNGISDNTLINRGRLQVDGEHDFGISLDGAHNHGFNDGTIVATGPEARAILLFGTENDATNRGVIVASGTDSIGVRFSADAPEGANLGVFTNLGELHAIAWAALGSSGNEQVVNRGSMAGLVDLGGGDDRYVAGSGGRLDGLLTLGDGNDLVVVEHHSGGLTISDFAAGTGSDDVLDLSAFHFHSFSELMAHAGQSGADVLINLGGGDQVTLLATTLSSLAAPDFIIG